MTKQTSLWELSDDIQSLERSISEIQDDDSLSQEELESQLEIVFNQWLDAGEDFKVKAENVASYIRHQEALAEARKTEAKRIQTLAKQADNSATRLRKYLTDQLLRSNIKKIDGVKTKISLRKKQPSLVVNVPTEELPKDYVKVTEKPDLTKIRALLKSDVKVDWASLSEDQEYSLTIR